MYEDLINKSSESKIPFDRGVLFGLLISIIHDTDERKLYTNNYLGKISKKDVTIFEDKNEFISMFIAAIEGKSYLIERQKDNWNIDTIFIEEDEFWNIKDNYEKRKQGDWIYNPKYIWQIVSCKKYDEKYNRIAVDKNFKIQRSLTMREFYKGFGGVID